MTFEEFTKRCHPLVPQYEGTIIALDPGETTGYAIFVHGLLKEAGQLKTKTIPVSVPLLQKFFDRIATVYPTTKIIVYENYKVYGWKTEDHSWSNLHTSQLLGTIQTLSSIRNVPNFTQMAQVAKAFCTDQKLKEWGYYRKGEKHARDAIRHGCYYLIHIHPKAPIQPSNQAPIK